MIKTEKVKKHYNKLALRRESYLRKSSYYYRDLGRFFKFNNCAQGSLLEIGCGNGFLLEKIKPKKGTGIDFSPEMIKVAQKRYSSYRFSEINIEENFLEEKFDH
ncbi:MAG: class I SAM-dependent methyltransferase, partial [Patescibacteria group bacterium]|nr:class I SAM-dependent methyltransferase [Patescibacteria group bacterium]